MRAHECRYNKEHKYISTYNHKISHKINHKNIKPHIQSQKITTEYNHKNMKLLELVYKCIIANLTCNLFSV